MTEVSETREGSIYIIRKFVNDKVYIGSTFQSLCARMNDHRKTAKGPPKKNENPMYKVMRAVGDDQFKILLLQSYTCESKHALETKEYEIMDTYDQTKLYNTRRSLAIQESTKEKMRKAVKETNARKEAAKLTTEERERMLAALLG